MRATGESWAMAAWRCCALPAAAALAFLFLLQPLAAQDAAELEAQRHERALERERILREIEIADEAIAALGAEIAALRKDSATLTAALVQAARSERKLSQDAERISGRLALLQKDEAELRASLVERRDLLAEVLGALQRMGFSPPPAILVSPEDALGSVRSAILLGSVVPGLRQETEVLIADLNELTHLTTSIAAEHQRLVAAMQDQALEQERIDLLLAEKERLKERSAEQLQAERERSEALAAEAGSLNELIDALEAEIEIARQAEEERREAEQPGEADAAAPPIQEPERFVRTPFEALLGQVNPPVDGVPARRFGEQDETGDVSMGDMFATQSGAIVTSPSDGSVLYAGPFRSYGQLLILNAGGGYHIVLAGMGRISVGLGQNVVAGEPVGAMSEVRVASSEGLESGNPQTELYVEFRRNGSPIDPSPWWADRNALRTGNGT